MLHNYSPEKRRRVGLACAIALGLLAVGGAVYVAAEKTGTIPFFETMPQSPSSQEAEPTRETFPTHENITATVFWVGEEADESNKFIQNRSSAWIEDWQGSFGGVDDPESRCDYRPCGFTPRENPFYFALPYNDLDDDGNKKASAKNVPWYRESSETILKNRWIKVTRDGKTAYAQWADVGPFGEDDFDYVFGPGDATPDAPEAGLDLSPGLADYLSVDGRDKVSWQFVEEADVPDGPWRQIVTKD